MIKITEERLRTSFNYFALIRHSDMSPMAETMLFADLDLHKDSIEWEIIKGYLYNMEEEISQTHDDMLMDYVEEQVNMCYEELIALEKPIPRKETRVYIVSDNLLGDRMESTITNEDFMTLAENNGSVWSLKEYQRAYNNGIYFPASNDSYIRFIEVDCFD